MLEAVALGAEDGEVGVPEAVDRLQLVADAEQARLGPLEGLDEAALHLVGVLVLVHEQVREPGGGLPDRLVALEQLEGAELKVLEVKAGPIRFSDS